MYQIKLSQKDIRLGYVRRMVLDCVRLEEGYQIRLEERYCFQKKGIRLGQDRLKEGSERRGTLLKASPPDRIKTKHILTDISIRMPRPRNPSWWQHFPRPLLGSASSIPIKAPCVAIHSCYCLFFLAYFTGRRLACSWSHILKHSCIIFPLISKCSTVTRVFKGVRFY